MKGEGHETTALRVPIDVAAATAFELKVSRGADLGAKAVVTADRASPFLVGKGPACDLRLADPEVSRRHLSLEVVRDGLRVTDLASTNGTRVGALEIASAVLRGGETIALGSTVLDVDRVEVAVTERSSLASFGRMMGASSAMQRLYPLCRRLADTTVPVLIEGETGTGKEVLAEAIHEEGPRAGGPFVVFDCTAVPASMTEAELFGHERGAFTGAVATRKGLLEQADGGTLFIDEIGDLDKTLQPKLLRVLERREVRRIGGTRSIQVDARIVAATRRDLDKEVQAGRFRDDLFHRLVVARVELPPLRARRGDVTRLARHFAKELGASNLPAELLVRWESYGWPGNVRELRNAVAAQVALGDLSVHRAAASAPTDPASVDLVAQVLSRDLPWALARQELLSAFETRYVQRALAAHGGNVVHAARAMGVHRRYLQKLKAKSDG